MRTVTGNIQKSLVVKEAQLLEEQRLEIHLHRVPIVNEQEKKIKIQETEKRGFGDMVNNQLSQNFDVDSLDDF